MRRSLRAVGRAKPLGHDAFAAKLAGVLKHCRAVDVVVLIDDDARMRATYELGELMLAVLSWAPKTKYVFDSALFLSGKVPPEKSESNPSAAERQTDA